MSPVVYHVGTSGWQYNHWRSRFYPQKLSKEQWLDFYARHFGTVEINNTYYQTPSEESVQRWYEAVPAGFVFALKMQRYVTHTRRLNETGGEEVRFMERVKPLKEKLGPVLCQLPRTMKRDEEKLDAFLARLPTDARYAVEFRDRSWFEQGIFDILRKHEVALCISDSPQFTAPLVATTDFAYFRFHGREAIYSSYYSDIELNEWAKRIAELAASLKQVYIYFNNDAEAFAVRNADALSGLLEGEKRLSVI